jgi:hypothetical protein
LSPNTTVFIKTLFKQRTILQRPEEIADPDAKIQSLIAKAVEDG